ncbi:tRNA (adenosine(37)-N6)-dimethylallyltransferase MiaA [Sphingomonas sp. BN140010]|uniref:tRNA dimethylallyltransferase n=1 Tax=Sphingomonas arvum TaxID=2992113 RepID=A0ABT3JE88_9SPHN|nr:tRNA (adenosine(37)-N6)-dimethylallyltransferase MiaA [Sphingomonas sp. BN140010]MCW3797387.1 tRNA (adenosine(37)-N6)-dimethylallyltransferase MiaA [Sphingomonas sp. BN140010]
MSKVRPPVGLIAGPTASGKSALALSWAERTNGVIINADSAQLYARLRVLSAGPAPADEARAEHRLFAFRDPAEPCSAAEWAALAKAEVVQAHRRGRLPILVGGTGLYLRTLLDGIAPIPPIDPAVRSAVRGASVVENHARLAEFDPGAAERLHPTDTTRIARSLEVVLSTGRPLADWQRERSGGIGAEIALRPLILLPPRSRLYARCDGRFAAMMDGGAADEVRLLLARRLDPMLPAMRAIGVREIAAWLRGEVTREQAVAAGAQATRNYAKRQYTWFAHQPPADWPRFAEPLDDEAAAERALALLDGSV